MAANTKGKKVVRKRRERKNVEKGQVHIRSSFNNTMVTVTDLQGNALSLSLIHIAGNPYRDGRWGLCVTTRAESSGRRPGGTRASCSLSPDRRENQDGKCRDSSRSRSAA